MNQFMGMWCNLTLQTERHPLAYKRVYSVPDMCRIYAVNPVWGYRTSLQCVCYAL